MKNVRNDEKGLTIVETVISISILAIGIIGMVGIIASLRTTDTLKNEIVAYKAAQDVMEQLMAMDFADLEAQDGVAFDVYDLIGIDSPANIGLIAVTDVYGDARLYELTITIVYAGDGSVLPIDVELTTRRSGS